MTALSLPSLSVLLLGLSVSLLEAEQEVYVSSPTDLTLKTGSASAPTLLATLNNTNVWGVCYNNADDSLYFSSPTSNEISQFSFAMSMLTVPIAEPGAVFHGVDAAGGALYALRSGSDDVVRYDLPSTTPNVLATGLMRPNDIAVDAGRDRMFVTDSGLDQVLEYSLNGVLQRYWPLSGAWGVAVSHIDGAVYISRYDSGELWKNELGSTSFSRIATGLDGPRGVEVERTGVVYVVEANVNRLVTVDVSTGVSSPTTYMPALNGHAMVVQESNDRDGDYLADDWEHSNYGGLTVSDGTSSGDGDEHTDLMEYAFMGDPSQPGSLIQNYVQNGSSGFSLQLPVVVDPNIRMRFMVSNDMLNWVTVTATSQTAIVDTNYMQNQFDFLESSYFIPTDGRLFFRALAEPNR